MFVCLSVRVCTCPRPHTVNVFFQYCVFSKFGFHISSGVDKHKIARDSSNAERLSRQRLGKLDRPEQAYERQRQRRATEQAERRQARQEQDRERPEYAERPSRQSRPGALNRTKQAYLPLSKNGYSLSFMLS